jgi:hypothetical protein
LLKMTKDNQHRAIAARSRVAIVLVVAISMAVGLIAGAYSGVLHAHDHDQSTVDHHHDGEVKTELADPTSQTNHELLSETTEGDNSPATEPAHEHPAEVVLSLATLPLKIVGVPGSSLEPSPAAVAFVHTFGPSDRPPRRA